MEYKLNYHHCHRHSNTSNINDDGNDDNNSMPLDERCDFHLTGASFSIFSTFIFLLYLCFMNVPMAIHSESNGKH